MAKQVVKKVVLKKAKEVKEEKEKTAETKTANNLVWVGTDIKKLPGLKKRQDLGNLEELKNSILSVGLTTPVGVLVDSKNKVFLVTGERRLAAIQQIESEAPGKFKKWFANGIPATIVAGDLLSARLVQMAENNGRKDYTVLELIEDVLASEADGASTKQIAQAIGKSETYIRNIKRFDKEASEQLKKSVQEGSVTFTDALLLMKKPEPQQEEAVEKIEKIKDLPRKEKEKAKREIKKQAQKEVGAGKSSTRPGRTELVKASEALLVEAFTKDNPVKVFRRSHVFFAVGKALEYAAGDIDESTFADIMESIVLSFESAKKEYERG